MNKNMEVYKALLFANPYSTCISIEETRCHLIFSVRYFSYEKAKMKSKIIIIMAKKVPHLNQNDLESKHLVARTSALKMDSWVLFIIKYSHTLSNQTRAETRRCEGRIEN